MGFTTKQVIKHNIKATLTFIFLLGCVYVYANQSTIQPDGQKMSMEVAKQLKFKNPDSTNYILQFLFDKGVRTKDTLLTINALLELASVSGHQANYKQSYDQLWSALLLADAAGLEIVKSNIYKAIYLGISCAL